MSEKGRKKTEARNGKKNAENEETQIYVAHVPGLPEGLKVDDGAVAIKRDRRASVSVDDRCGVTSIITTPVACSVSLRSPSKDCNILSVSTQKLCKFLQYMSLLRDWPVLACLHA